jgi:hypothetical protein
MKRLVCGQARGQSAKAAKAKDTARQITAPPRSAKLAELDGRPLPQDPNNIDRHHMAALLDG